MKKQQGLFGLSTLGLMSAGIIALVLATAFVGQALVLQKAQREKATLALQLQAMTKDRDAAVQVAQENAVTIARLQVEKQDLEKANVEIEKARVQTEAGRSARESAISSQAGSSASKAKTAPVISATIDSIQKSRRRP